jgi:hypothetical protein
MLNPDNSHLEAQASATTFWQNVNTSYVFLYAITLLLLFKLDLISQRQNYTKWNLVIFLFSGIFVGLSSAVIVASVFLFVLLAPIGAWLDGKRLRKRNVFFWGLFNLGMLVAAVISFLSPGSQRRKTFLPDISLNMDTIALLTKSMIPSLVDWWKALLNQGILVSAAMALLIAILLAWQGYEFHIKNLQRTAFQIIAFSLILSIVVGYSQVFAYVAYWHRIGMQVVLWIGITILSFSTCLNLMKLRPRLSQLSFVLVVLMVVNTLAVSRMHDEISERYSRWQVGPAPTTHVTDIEHVNGWQRACYLKIKEQRGGPDRGLKRNPPMGDCD